MTCPVACDQVHVKALLGVAVVVLDAEVFFCSSASRSPYRSNVRPYHQTSTSKNTPIAVSPARERKINIRKSAPKKKGPMMPSYRAPSGWCSSGTGAGRTAGSSPACRTPPSTPGRCCRWCDRTGSGPGWAQTGWSSSVSAPAWTICPPWRRICDGRGEYEELCINIY